MQWIFIWALVWVVVFAVAEVVPGNVQFDPKSGWAEVKKLFKQAWR